MISTSAALKVIAVIQACHPRTAPRTDDQEVALATASTWAELFNAHGLTLEELIAAVKSRAAVCPDAPEVADLIRVARSARSDRMARTPSIADDHYPGAAYDLAEYPVEWDAQQRVTAYWFAMRRNALPRTTAGWEALAREIAS